MKWFTVHRARRIFPLVIVIATLISCDPSRKKQTVETVPLPEIKETVYLKVAYAINPRFPRMSESQVTRLLEETQSVARDHFNVKIQFSPVETITIAELFKLIPEKIKTNRLNLIYDFKTDKGDYGKLVSAMKEVVEQNPDYSVEELIEQASPYLLVDLTDKSADAFSEALVDTLLTRLKEWTKLEGKDGNPIIDETSFNEWAMWDVIGYGELAYDIVLTNQLIASAEYYGQSIHSAIRGGVVAGTTSFSKSNELGTFVFWSTFLYSNDFEILVNLRDGDLFDETEAARLSGAYLAHEIGHQLFHFGHPYGKSACVMNPVELLNFRKWYEQIDPIECPVGDSPPVTPGYIGIQYFTEYAK